MPLAVPVAPEGGCIGFCRCLRPASQARRHGAGNGLRLNILPLEAFEQGWRCLSCDTPYSAAAPKGA